MRNFWRLAWLSYKGLYITWHGHAYIFRVLLTPILWVLIISLFGKFAAHPRVAEGYIVGMTVFSLPFVIVDGIVGAFQYERTYGTLSILFVSPVNRLKIFLSRGAVHWANGIVTLAASLVAAWAILGLDFSEVAWVPAFCSILALAAASIGFALLLGNITIISARRDYTFQFAYGFMLMFSGVVIPTSSLPPVLSWVSQVIPVTHGLAAARASFAGAGLAEVGGLILTELLIGITYALVGAVLFRVVEAQAKRLGNLEQMGKGN